ncbi:phytanoyl-CoA dioxygenase family protein [Henriciella mobilis]|uniref:Phytanoyl-CoA dioxygenase n=1 Tax=Henriciella mobilis TaxID=2305467 RepID=A0A399RU74_9PROT|nr:phytanoyl-CoA dioxygenase family protein [Henriciella mobilis]RIJ33015.1 phytanoyl-CoA dioxygenase [Henriciella mobilis]
MKTGSINTDIGVFHADELDALDAFFREHGFAILRRLYQPADLERLTNECVDAQTGVIEGKLDPRHGNSVLLDDAVNGEKRFANYVQYITEVSPATRAAILHPAITALMEKWVPGGHLREHSRFGAVYQDARGGSNSGYRRIGWHSDWQSGPHMDCWPSVAFTIHIDATSPENGFLRVVPGSHKWATPAPFRNANNVPVPAQSKPVGGYTDEPPPYDMPLAFEKAPGEIAVYCEAGDVLFHDAYLWHSAAVATNDRAVRRHVRGGWFTGVPDGRNDDFVEDFVKNAAR